MVKYHRRDEIVQKEVIEYSAQRVGVVKDIAYTLDGNLALVVDAISEKGHPHEGFLPFNKIVKIGDVILIKSSADLEIIAVAEKICPNCKSKNPIDSTFCFKCGITLKKKT